MSWQTARRGEFRLQLDGTIVTAALPSLRADLGVDVAAASWVLNAFFVAFGGLPQPAGGSATRSATAGCSWPGSAW